MPLVKKNKKVLIIAPYQIGLAPGQRFRFEQYLDYLSANNFTYKQIPFYTIKTNRILYDKGKLVKKSIGILLGYFLRFTLLFTVGKFDYIFLFREATPLGPPIIEWIIAKILKKKIIYDFDDAIWLNDPDEKGSLIAKMKQKNKVASICKWSYKVSVGNKFLADFAKKFNANVIINPTTIDTSKQHNPDLYKGFPFNNEGQIGEEKLPVIGWTGTHSTIQYLTPIIPIIQNLEKRLNFVFLIIANKNPQFDLKSFRYIEWSRKTEIKDLMKIDIGIMPLTDDEWSKGKCGFKLLQYMALNIPAVATPVGVNSTIIETGINGYLCNTENEWEVALELLLNDRKARDILGKRGREKVLSDYSTLSNQDNFITLFE